MLRLGGIVAFDDADFPAVRKVCRFIANNRTYSVVGTCGYHAPSLKHRIIEACLRSLPLSMLCPGGKFPSDLELGLQGSCIAFRKEEHDDRRWDHFIAF
jgi:hypothetical protein